MAPETPHLHTKVVESKDGTKIYAEACGDHSQPHIVFVHGIACTSVAFDPLFSLPECQKKLFLVRYDMRGHGRSGKPTTENAYESRCYSDDFDAVCKAFRLSNPVYVGWSYAGSIAADICANICPLPIRGVILLAGILYIGDILPIVLSPLLLSLLSPLATAETPTAALQARLNFCHSLVSDEVLPKVPHTDMAAWIGDAVYLAPDCAKYILHRKQDPLRLFEEGAKGLPLCIINGTEDRFVTGQAVVEQAQPLFKDFEAHDLKGIGHMLVWEDPRTVADIILKFVARINHS